MAGDALDDALNFVLRSEGGCRDHPDDPAGRNNKGIAQKVCDRVRAQQGQPAFGQALRQLLAL